MKSTTKKALAAAGFKVYGAYVMVDGSLYPLPLVQGNSKLGKKVWHSATLPTNKMITAHDAEGNELSEMGTCPTTCNGCYGTKGNYNFNSSKYAIMMRTKLLRNYPAIYFQLVRIQIENEDIEKLRIHSVGDFIKGEARGFYEVLKDFPHVKAWTYTKVENDPDIILLDSLKNCNVVKSIIKGCGFNFGHVDYVMDLFNMLKKLGKKVYICRCGIDENQHCSDCNGCSDHEYVLFIEHSTGYNAKNDAKYPEIVELIENQ